MAIKVGSCTVIDDTRNLANVCSISLVSGNQGTTGQVLKSQGAGQPSTWGAVDAITNYAYESRGSLRDTTPTDGSQAYVGGLGYFVFELASTEPDDDETAFRTATGAWILSAPSWDFTKTYAEFERLGRNYSVLVDNTIGSVQGIPVCMNVNIPGASPGDFYQVQPYCGCPYNGEVRARYVEATGCVQIIGSVPCICSSISVSCGYGYICVCNIGVFNSVCKWVVYVQKV
jgi:hypothetical protein